MVRSFLLYVLFSFSLMHATNVCSAAWYDNKLVHAVSCVFSNKKLFEAIASLQEAMQEINDKNIKHLRTDVLCDFHIGDHRYIHKNHYYTGGSEGIELVKRYKDALDHFETVYPLLEVRDAAFLGALTAMINEQLEGERSRGELMMLLSVVFWTLAKPQYIGNVSYLDFPTLILQNNCFGGVLEYLIRLSVSTLAALISHAMTYHIIKAVKAKKIVSETDLLQGEDITLATS